jgi:hypothetical protein
MTHLPKSDQFTRSAVQVKLTFSFLFAGTANFKSSAELNSAQSHVRCAIFASFSHDISVRVSSDARIDTYALRIGARQLTRLYRLHRR